MSPLRTSVRTLLLARNQGANAPPGLPLGSPLVRETNGMARPPPGRARLQRVPAEIRVKKLNHKAPRTGVGAFSRGRARPFVRLYGKGCFVPHTRPSQRRLRGGQCTYETAETASPLPPNAHIDLKPALFRLFLGIDVAKVGHAGDLHLLGHLGQVQRAEFVPFG